MPARFEAPTSACQLHNLSRKHHTRNLIENVEEVPALSHAPGPEEGRMCLFCIAHTVL